MSWELFMYWQPSLPLDGGSQNAPPSPAASAIPRNLSKRQILRCHPRSSESAILGRGGTQQFEFSGAHSNLRTPSLHYCPFVAHTPSPGWKKLLSRVCSILPSPPWKTPTQLSDLYLEVTLSTERCLDCPGWIQSPRALRTSLLHVPNHIKLVHLNDLSP